MTSIIELSEGDRRALAEHLVAHSAESGAGEPHFTPAPSTDIEETELGLVSKLATTIDELRWFRFFGVYDGGGRLVGHADLRGEGLEAARHRCVFGIGVLREARGQGIGRALTEHAIAFARGLGFVEWIDLYVFEHNAAARELYRSVGFVEVGCTEDRFVIHGEPVADVHMVLRLR